MGAILVTTDMVGIYPSISHIESLEVLRKHYGKFVLKKVFLSLISSFSNKYVEPLLVLNLLPIPLIVFLWTSLKQNFLRHNL